MSFAKAMSYEKTPVRATRIKETDLNRMSSSKIIWYLVVKHKFGLLATFSVTYVAFSLFGTLIVGLVESL